MGALCKTCPQPWLNLPSQHDLGVPSPPPSPSRRPRPRQGRSPDGRARGPAMWNIWSRSRTSGPGAGPRGSARPAPRHFLPGAAGRVAFAPWGFGRPGGPIKPRLLAGRPGRSLEWSLSACGGKWGAQGTLQIPPTLAARPARVLPKLGGVRRAQSPPAPDGAPRRSGERGGRNPRNKPLGENQTNRVRAGGAGAVARAGLAGPGRGPRELGGRRAGSGSCCWGARRGPPRRER